MIQSKTSMCYNESSTICFWNERIWPCHSRLMLIFLGQVRFRKMQKLEKVGKFNKYFKELLWLLLFPVLKKGQWSTKEVPRYVLVDYFFETEEVNDLAEDNSTSLCSTLKYFNVSAMYLGLCYGTSLKLGGWQSFTSMDGLSGHWASTLLLRIR